MCVSRQMIYIVWIFIFMLSILYLFVLNSDEQFRFCYSNLTWSDYTFYVCKTFQDENKIASDY